MSILIYDMYKYFYDRRQSKNKGLVSLHGKTFIVKLRSGAGARGRVVWLDRWRAGDAPLGCLSRSVGPSWFPLSPLFSKPLKTSPRWQNKLPALLFSPAAFGDLPGISQPWFPPKSGHVVFSVFVYLFFSPPCDLCCCCCCEGGSPKNKLDV